MKFISLIFLVCYFNTLIANVNNFEELYEINKEWIHYKNQIPSEGFILENESDAIQTHLLLVCQYLKENSSEHLNSYQLLNRFKLIESLEKYAKNKVFPTNTFHQERTPYFVDIYGVHCAVGFLMKESGYTELVAKIKENENYKYIKNIQTAGINEWAEKFGFTIDELKWIQPSYLPSPDLIQAMDEGTNGPVNKITNSSHLNALIVSGDFDSLNLEPCLNIGIYQNNQFSCLGGGVSGKINNISANHLRTVLFGLFDFNGEKYSMAIYDENGWNYLNIPSREGYISTSGFEGMHGLEVAIHHPDSLEKQEIWIQIGTNSWNKELEINGFVNQIGASAQGRIFAGWFSEGVTFDNQGNTLDTIYTKNVIFRNHHNNNTWEAINGTDICDTVHSFVRINSQIYFAGSSSGLSSSNNIILSRYLNNTFQPLLYSTWFGAKDHVSIKAIEVNNNNNSLIIGGDFIYNPLIGIGGHNLAYFNIFHNSLSFLAVLDNKVNTLVTINKEIYFGGDFRQNHSIVDINYIGRVNTTLNTQNEQDEKTSINIYPNPFKNFIYIENVNPNENYQIYNTQGKLIKEGTVNYDSKIHLSSLPKGIYYLNIRREQEIIQKKIVKN